MSNTRHSTSTDPARAPERNLSSTRLRPINVSLALACQAARSYAPELRRACLWLANLAANSQRIQLCWQRRGLPDPLGTVGRIAEADLARHLGLDPIDIYQALTGDEQADLPRFLAAVQAFRAKFEAMLPPLVKTEDTGTIAEAFRTAAEEHRITVLSGKWRHGKTEEGERQWLKNLDNTVWLHCPSDNIERSFVIAFAAALGISTGGGKKPERMKDQIRRALGIGLIERVVIDEAHNLWPDDLAGKKPLRAEYVRECTDTLGVGFVLMTTDQFALALEVAKNTNSRWAPGQFLGRRAPFTLRDAHTDREIAAIARLHAGAIEDAAVEALVLFAKADEGYLGAMVLAAGRARKKAGAGATITAAEIAEATVKQQVDKRVAEIARGITPGRRGRIANVVPMGRRAA